MKTHCEYSNMTLIGPSLSSPAHTSPLPYKQLLIAEGSGAMGIIISPLSLSSSCPVLVVCWCWCCWHWCWCHHCYCLLPSLPSPFLLIIIMEMVTGPLAPDPPCEQGLAVVGGGCWGAVLSTLSSCTWHCTQAAPMIHLMSSCS